ncbi:MAG: hypothetical protein HY098_06060 [Nitrospinae bacterium]|nr:hypothetical protein [Nitrospinota bacterium]
MDSTLGRSVFCPKNGVHLTFDVVLQTPYGATVVPFKAVSADHKLENNEIKPGNVGHDRIQQAGADESIGEAIRKWYGLPKGDFEKIGIEAVFQHKKLPSGKKNTRLTICPISAKMRGGRTYHLTQHHRPLSIDKDYISLFWKNQYRASCKLKSKDQIRWAMDQIAIVVADNLGKDNKNIHEADILRVSGALSVFGVQLGPYRTNGYDCEHSKFEFHKYPPYFCPVEIKKDSKGFKYQEKKYFPLPRAVVLCLEHNHKKIPEHIDVIELQAFDNILDSTL